MQALRLLSIAAVLIAVTADAQAQRYRRGYSYRAPYGVAVSPFGYSVRTPYYSYGVSPGYVSPSRYSVRYGWPGVNVRVEGRTVSPVPSTSVEVTSPTPAMTYGEAPAYSPSAAQVSPSAVQVDGDLIGQLDQAIAALNARFDQFNGGAGWQRYLTSDGGGVADPRYRDTLLRRMNSVATNAQYQAVSQLPEFQKVHELLQIIATPPAAPERPALPSVPVEAGPATDGAESIPVPSSALDSSVQTGGERSVLAK